MLTLLMACQGRDAPGSSTSDEEVPPDCTVDSTLVVLTTAVFLPPGLATEAVLSVDLSAPASVAAACTSDTDPDEVHLVEGASATTHRLLLDGLLADTSYTCRIAPTCPQASLTSPSLQFTTGPLPDALPTVTASGDPSRMEGGAFTLFNHQQACTADGTQHLIVVDPEGRTRWYLPLPNVLNLGVEARPTADGRIVWGGGGGPEGAPQIVRLDGTVDYAVSFAGADDTTFEHDGKLLADGTLLALSEAPNEDGVGTFNGFRLQTFDPATNAETWSWNSQSAVDAGVLGAGDDNDPWHVNWADISADGDTAWVSLCDVAQVLTIDVASGDVTGVLGAGGDYELRDADGVEVGFGNWFQCQHGLEIDGDRLLVYDNGIDRQHTRVLELEVDTEAHTADIGWTWTGTDGWFETTLGDVDWLPNGHVLVDRAHSECISSDPGVANAIWEVDHASGDIVWSLTMDDIDSATYRAERVESCLLWQDSRYCEATRTRLAELDDVLGG